MELDHSVLYESPEYEDLETVRTNDYTAYQLRSFAFCRAQTIANRRLHRLDEFKAVTDQISSKEGLKSYQDLREEIIESHAIQADKEDVKELSKKDKIEHNKQAAQSIIQAVK